MKRSFFAVVATSFACLGVLAVTIGAGTTGPGQFDASESVIERLNRLAEQLRLESQFNVPIGTVVAFAGSEVPPGWLLCDGSSVAQKDYPELSSVLGDIYGRGPDGTMFTLPNYQGRFLRGNPQSGRALGSIQAQSTALPRNPFGGTTASAGAHTHTATFDGRGGKLPTQVTRRRNAPQTDAGTTDKFSVRYSAGTEPSIALSQAGAHTHGFRVTTGGDSETRPANISVQYIIKASLTPNQP